MSIISAQQTIIRAPRDRDHPYFSIRRKTVQDGTLSFEARGLLVYILSKPSNWRIQVGDLMREGHCGRDRVLRILKELGDAGYIVKEKQTHTETGKFTPAVLSIREIPFTEKALTVEGEPSTENPLTAEPGTAEPSPEIPVHKEKESLTDQEIEQKSEDKDSPSPTESIDSVPSPALVGVGDGDLDLLMPEIRKLTHLSPDAQTELLAFGPPYALAMVWDCTRPGVTNPAGLAVSKMRNGGPAADLLVLAGVALELAAETGKIDREAADRALKYRELGVLREQAADIVAAQESEEPPPPARAPLPAETVESVTSPALTGLDDPVSPGGTLTWADVWMVAQGTLAAQLNGLTYQNYLARADASAYADGVLTICAPNFMAMEMLTAHYQAAVEEAVRKAAGGEAVTVALVTRQKIYRQWVGGELVELAGTAE